VDGKRPSTLKAYNSIDSKIPKNLVESSSASNESSSTNSQRPAVNKPKINHHFINAASPDDNLTKSSKNTTISPSLSLNQMGKTGLKPSNSIQSAALSKHLINATAPVKSQLCSGFR
jgi:hypothetical protein